jgi:hypothetical protein
MWSVLSTVSPRPLAARRPDRRCSRLDLGVIGREAALSLAFGRQRGRILL